MKIILANKFFYPRGGDCIHTIQLKQLLEEHNHEVSVFSMQYQENLACKEAIYWPSEVSFIDKSPQKLISALKRPFGVKEVKYKWKKLLDEFKPDVVHLHNIHSQISPVIAKLAKKRNIPVVWTLHDYKLLCPAYTFRDSNGNICEECLVKPNSVIKKRCVKRNLLASTLGYLEGKKWNRKELEEVTDLFISPSKFLKCKMEDGGFVSNKIMHIPNFIENKKFVPEIVYDRNEDVVFVGRLSPEKGVETLCRAFKKIITGKLIIIGDGPLKEYLQKQYMSENILFLGYQTWDVIKERISKAAFTVIPSEWYENNPLSMIESFSLGTPVLGANIGGIPELITKENGLLFESGSIEDLETMINKMLYKNDWNYQMISTKAVAKFSAEKYYSLIFNKYQDVAPIYITTS